MSDKRFDDIIKGKLADFQSQGQAKGWTELKAKMAAADTHFDDKVKDKLEQYSTPLQDDSWSQLYGKYQRQKYLRNQVIAIKSGELLILLLCFFTFWNYTNLLDFNNQKDARTIAVNAQEQNKLYSSSERDLEKSVVSLLSDSNIATVDQGESEKKSNTDIISSGIIINQKDSDEDVVVVDRQDVNSNVAKSQRTISESNQDDYSIIVERDAQNRADLSEVESGDLNLNPGSISASTMNSELSNQKKDSDIFPPSILKSFSLLDSRLAFIDPFERKLPFINTSTEEPKENWSRSAHFYTSINNYTILSPRDEIYNVDEQILYTPGFSINALYGFSKKGIDILSGISYSRISYEPYPVQETYQSEEGINIISLTQIQYDIISVPLLLRKHLIQTDDWSLFGGVGLQAGLVINEHYGIDDRLDVPIPRPESARGDARYRSKLSEKEFTRAVFNGGKFSENVFLHGSFHAGVERKLNSKTSLYLSFEYARHLLSPLGPNNDKINILSFGAGARFNLN